MFHRRNRQSILTDQNVSLSREGTIVCYRSVNKWYILQRIVRCGERGDVRSPSCFTKDVGVSPTTTMLACESSLVFEKVSSPPRAQSRVAVVQDSIAKIESDTRISRFSLHSREDTWGRAVPSQSCWCKRFKIILRVTAGGAMAACATVALALAFVAALEAFEA